MCDSPGVGYRVVPYLKQKGWSLRRADKQSGIYRVAFTAQTKWILNFERVVLQITGAELLRALTGHFAWPKS